MLSKGQASQAKKLISNLASWRSEVKCGRQMTCDLPSSNTCLPQPGHATLLMTNRVPSYNIPELISILAWLFNCSGFWRDRSGMSDLWTIIGSYISYASFHLFSYSLIHLPVHLLIHPWIHPLVQLLDHPLIGPPSPLLIFSSFTSIPPLPWWCTVVMRRWGQTVPRGPSTGTTLALLRQCDCHYKYDSCGWVYNEELHVISREFSCFRHLDARVIMLKGRELFSHETLVALWLFNISVWLLSLFVHVYTLSIHKCMCVWTDVFVSK